MNAPQAYRALLHLSVRHNVGILTTGLDDIADLGKTSVRLDKFVAKMLIVRPGLTDNRLDTAGEIVIGGVEMAHEAMMLNDAWPSAFIHSMRPVGTESAIEQSHRELEWFRSLCGVRVCEAFQKHFKVLFPAILNPASGQIRENLSKLGRNRLRRHALRHVFDDSSYFGHEGASDNANVDPRLLGVLAPSSQLMFV